MNTAELSKYKDYVYYGFESAIPQINTEIFDDMEKVMFLNEIAKSYQQMDTNERIKYKAVLSSEKVNDIWEAYLFIEMLDKYEISDTQFEENKFFKDYLKANMKSDFDTNWLNKIDFSYESRELISRLGAKITDYGVVSAYGQSLYHAVSRYDNESDFRNEDSEEVKGFQVNM